MLNPDTSLAHVGIAHGDTIADLGAGSGLVATLAAKRTGGAGKVYAVEVQKELVETINRKAVEEGVTNIETIWGDIDEPGGTKLGDRICDIVILSNALFQLENTPEAAKEIKRILKPGGKLLVVDWTDSHGGLGPHKDAVVTAEAAKQIFRNVGMEELETFDAGSHHYGIVFKKA